MLEKVQTKPQLQNLLNHKIRKDNVLLLPIDFESGDVVLSARDYEEKPEWGFILGVGEQVTGLSAGDVILYMSYGGTKVKALGQDFIYVREEDIISVHTDKD